MAESGNDPGTNLRPRRFWKISRGRDTESQRGGDRALYARAYHVVPVGGGDESQTVVEFIDGPDVRATRNAAHRAFRPYLARQERPPRRLIVRRDGTVSEERD